MFCWIFSLLFQRQIYCCCEKGEPSYCKLVKSISQQSHNLMYLCHMGACRELPTINSSGYLLYSRFTSAYAGYKTFTNILLSFAGNNFKRRDKTGYHIHSFFHVGHRNGKVFHPRRWRYLFFDDCIIHFCRKLFCIFSLQGMEHIHSVDIKFHGHLTSSNCVIDSRWVLKITDHGLREFKSANDLLSTRRTNNELDYSSMIMQSYES